MERAAGGRAGARAWGARRASSWRWLLPLALLAVAFHRVAGALVETWRSNENYSHGPLVPLVSAALVWGMRDRLRGTPARADARGLLLVALGVALLAAGQRGTVLTLQGYALLVTLAGLVWTLGGAARLRVLAFPILYLVFMLPFPAAFVNQLSYGLKEVTVRLSTAAAAGLGVSLQREGMNLYLETGLLKIENPCSGLRSLISLLATGALFAWIQPGGAWRKAALFLAAAPLAMAGNALRIAGLILVAHYAGLAEATGSFHQLSGLAVFAAALAGMLALRAWLTPRAALAGAAR